MYYADRYSLSYHGPNSHIVKALAEQKADYLFGGVLILVSFVFQLVSFLAPNQTVLTDAQSQAAPWIAIVSTVVVFFMLRIVARRLARRYEGKVKSMLG